MENIGGVIFFAVVVIMFGITAYLYFYGDDLNLKFWGNDGEEIPEVNDTTIEEPVNETVVNGTDINVTAGNETDNNETDEDLDEINSTYLHWSDKTITYKILNKNGCWGSPIQGFEEAISIIEDGAKGAVDFLEVQTGEYDIEVRCVNKTDFIEYLENTTSVTCQNHTIDTYKENFDPIIEGFIEDDFYYVSHRTLKQNDTYSNFEYCYYDTSSVGAGNYSWGWFFESEPEIENGVIKSHKITIYDEASNRRCAAIPSREIHELFHGLGFAHVETPKYYEGYGWSPADFYLLEDIMFEYRYCTFQDSVQQKYFDCLQKVYLGADEDCEDVVFLN